MVHIGLGVDMREFALVKPLVLIGFQGAAAIIEEQVPSGSHHLPMEDERFCFSQVVGVLIGSLKGINKSYHNCISQIDNVSYWFSRRIFGLAIPSGSHWFPGKN